MPALTVIYVPVSAHGVDGCRCASPYVCRYGGAVVKSTWNVCSARSCWVALHAPFLLPPPRFQRSRVPYEFLARAASVSYRDGRDVGARRGCVVQRRERARLLR